MNTSLEKFDVCDRCYCLGIVSTDCVCSYDKYTTIELEFEVCECCGKLISDGYPAETPFNEEQIRSHKKSN